MNSENIRYLMSACMFFQDWNSYEYISNFEKIISKNDSFSIINLKDELQNAMQNDNFDWVKLAVETKFVYTSNMQQLSFNVDELLIHTGSANWSFNSKDAQLSFDERENLKSQFREEYIQNYKDIKELISDSEYTWLPFEIKHSFLSAFSPIEYTNEDIIYYLKSIVWDYLFPDKIDLERLGLIKKECQTLLENKKSNEGWLEEASIVESLNLSFPNLDLHELSQVKWDKTVQHKAHYRNPFTLGFIRKRPLS